MPSLADELSVPLDDDNQVHMTFRRIPRGGFLMGARGADRGEPRHWVEISDDFYLGQYPVTQQQFSVWTALSGEKHRNHHHGYDRHPAENMSWQQATAFCQWLNERLALVIEKLPEAQQLQARLPTEAQWEYACSAWQELDGEAVEPARRLYTQYHTGDGEEALARAGWFGGNSGYQTHPIGQKAANRHGLLDMHGNVLEWCRDAWSEGAYRWREKGVFDAMLEGENSAYRVQRGGSYDNTAECCRAAFRYRFLPDFGDRSYGFRAGLFPVRRSSEAGGAAGSR